MLEEGFQTYESGAGNVGVVTMKLGPTVQLGEGRNKFEYHINFAEKTRTNLTNGKVQRLRRQMVLVQ